MFYQLDYYVDFVRLNNQITESDDSYSVKGMFFHLYKNFINIDMMMQRGFYLQANNELNNLKDIITNFESQNKTHNIVSINFPKYK